MKVLSLFDGMACGMLAMLESGVPVDRYVAYEIDKYAVQTASHNFPMIEQRGDVFQADFTEFCGFDYIVGGSPCTYWSIAQKNGRQTEASGLGWELFSQYARAVREVQPRYFIYENNKSMSTAIRESITQTFGFEPICINSARVSAQNRQRLYWVGKRNPDGTYSKVDAQQPEDLGVMLRDILDGGARRDFDRSAEPIGTTGNGKSYCLTASYSEGGGEKVGNYAAHTLTKGCKSMVAEPVLPREDGKTVTLTAVYYKKGNNPFSNVQQEKSAPRVAEPVWAAGTGEYEQWPYAVPIEFENGVPTRATSGADGKTYIVHEVRDGKIAIKGGLFEVGLPDGYYIIRKLTVTECKRLQTVPEWYEFPVSDTQAYKMLGNGWTVKVISHLIDATVAAAAEPEEEPTDLPPVPEVKT